MIVIKTRDGDEVVAVTDGINWFYDGLGLRLEYGEVLDERKLSSLQEQFRIEFV